VKERWSSNSRKSYCIEVRTALIDMAFKGSLSKTTSWDALSWMSNAVGFGSILMALGSDVGASLYTFHTGRG
jgi:hypothetical protein